MGTNHDLCLVFFEILVLLVERWMRKNKVDYLQLMLRLDFSICHLSSLVTIVQVAVEWLLNAPQFVLVSKWVDLY